MTITNRKPLTCACLMLMLFAAPQAYGEDQYYGTSRDYQPGQFQRSGVDNPIMKKLLPPDIYNRRKANYERWDAMTPEQQEQERRERFRKRDFRQPAPPAAVPRPAPAQQQETYQNPAPGGTVGIDAEDGRALYNAPAPDNGDYYPPAANEGYSPSYTQR